MYDFTGRTFVVAGGTGSLGGALARALAGCGANVAVLGRNMDAARRLLESMESQSDSLRHAQHAAEGCHFEAIQADVLDLASLRRAAEVIADRFGQVDGLVNAAGGNKPGATTSTDLSFFDLPEDALRAVLDLNVLGTILPCQVFGRGMAERGEGVILNISSMNAFRPLTRVSAYSAAKAGVSNFTQWLAVHMAQNYSPRIRVNAIAPGFFLTEQNRFLLTDPTTGELTPRGRAIIAHTPMGRFGVPEDLVGAALWLLSPASAFVTGIVVPVDGGFSAYSGV
jgi:NAD(P)-dependent dehydrogenase (short-subunit alcohol dehydrogenase family)